MAIINLRELGKRFNNPFSREMQEKADPFKLYTLEDDERIARSFSEDAESALLTQDPLRARLAIRVVASIAAVFLIWAMFSHVDEMTKGEGKVIPSKQLQVLQSLDGGIVEEIMVREGQQVREGQTLVKIDPTRFVSGFLENQASSLALQAKAARLQAIADGRPFTAPPEVKAKDPDLALREEALYLNSRAELDGQLSIAREQMRQRSNELAEAQARHAAASDGMALTSKELALTRPLVASGAVSDVDLLRLERDVTRYSGEKSQALAQISRLRAAISEAQSKISTVELEFKNKARTELAETRAKISSLGQTSVALSDKVKQSELKSPVNGTVKRLLFNTVGGVVQPGKDVIEIVPSEDALILETKVNPRDIAFLHPGQKANVKFTAYDFAIYGSLEGSVESISADSLSDEKGRTYYVVRVRTQKSTLGDRLPIIPGMVAEVDILTGKKTVLSYLLKPILRAKQVALTER